MPIVTTEHVFDLPVDELWALIGDFGDTGKWSGRPPEGCVQEGEGIGALRTLTLADGRKIVDRLEAQTANSYSYSIVTAPLPYKSYRATMAVTPIDAASSRFTWTGEFEPRGMSDEAAISFTKSVYAMGIGLMQKTLAARS
jgi:mxaD protein